MKSFVFAASVSTVLMTGAAIAQVPLDLSQAKVSVQSSQTLRIENMSIPGYGNFQLSFTWNPTTLSFEPVVSSLISNGAFCEKATANGNLNYTSDNRGTYLWRQRSTPGLTVGALTSNNSFASSFTVTWAKTASANENPYLSGKTVGNFDATKSYGIIGRSNTGAYPNLTEGSLVEVTGGLASGAFIIKQVGGTAAATFTLVANSSQTTTNCLASSNGQYSGAMENSNNLRTYAASIVNGNSGSLTTTNSFASSFTATWDGSFQGKRGFNFGTVSIVNDAAYPRFSPQGSVFVADIGDGFSFTSINATGQVTSTAAFLKY